VSFTVQGASFMMLIIKVSLMFVTYDSHFRS
jgi:hypothetical protein